jgi:acetyl-CoA acetyltransferase
MASNKDREPPFGPVACWFGYDIWETPVRVSRGYRSVAVREGIMGTASGMYDMVLVGRTEKMRTLSTNWTTMALACQGKGDHNIWLFRIILYHGGL